MRRARGGALRLVPIRVRLAVAFAVVMAVVLAATGGFVYARLAGELDNSIDRDVAAQLARIVAVVRDDGDDLGSPEDDPLARLDEPGLVQVLDGRGVAGTTLPPLRRRAVLGRAQLDGLRGDGDGRLETTVRALDERFRLSAAVARDDGVDYTVIVGASLARRDEALAALRNVLLIGGPIALVLASLAAYGVASGALRPVETMRRRASEISTGEAGQRLPVPPAHDEIAQLGTTLNEMLARIERAFERERSFSAIASHELRTPLTILKTELDLASRRGRTREELEDAIASASEETERLVLLAEDLLILARADEGRLPLDPEPIEIVDLAERVRERFRRRAAADRRALVVAAPERRLTVMADPARIEQALANLVDNALRHGDGQVSIQAYQRNGRVELHVLDEGAGFPAEIAGKAFERFAHGHDARARGGTGLGLAIVAAIAQAHDASAHAENRAVGGADVWLSIPAMPP